MFCENAVLLAGNSLAPFPLSGNYHPRRDPITPRVSNTMGKDKSLLKKPENSKRKPRQSLVLPFEAPPELCKALEQIGKCLRVSSGTILFRQGEQNSGVYVVMSGRFALSAGDDPYRVTRIAQKGSLLGLPATIRQKPYSLTAEAVTDSVVWLVSPERFRNLLSENTTLGFVVLTMLADEVSNLRRLQVRKV
jgi:CRP-like cAMP-binding protein